jgi:crotonobetainyl-CoA:carnitine CoA-transferase CaiB-like acyl-CoA transferase
MISLSGYGAYGPDHDKVSYGPAQVPLSGLSSLTGYRGHPPMHVGVSYGDPTAGLHGAVAVLAALLHRARTGAGQYIDLSQWETSIAVLGDAIIGQSFGLPAPARDGNRVAHMAPHGVFPARGDDRWIAIAVEDDAAWCALTAVMEAPQLARDPRFASLAQRKANEGELEAIVARWTAGQDPGELTAVLQGAGIPSSVVATNRDLAEDPHLAARGAFTRFPHPEVGSRQHLGAPWRLSASPPGVTRAAPCLGADTEQVLRDVCGYGPGDIETLRAAGALT